jgi:hypothetical protein
MSSGGSVSAPFVVTFGVHDGRGEVSFTRALLWNDAMGRQPLASRVAVVPPPQLLSLPYTSSVPVHVEVSLITGQVQAPHDRASVPVFDVENADALTYGALQAPLVR